MVIFHSYVSLPEGRPGESLGCFGHPKDGPTSHLQCVAHTVAGRWLPPPAFWKASAEKFPWRNEVFEWNFKNMPSMPMYVYRIPMHDPKWWFSYFLLKIWDSRAFWISIVYCRVVSWAIPKLRSRRCSRDYIVGRWQWMMGDVNQQAWRFHLQITGRIPSPARNLTKLWIIANFMDDWWWLSLF